MAAVGPKQTFRRALVMSALPPQADICSALVHVRFGPKADSCTAANDGLFDHFVGAGEHAYWNDETKLIRGLAVDD